MLAAERLSPPVDVMLSSKDVFQPDIVFVSRENKRIVKRKKIDGAPDIVIEILSPATAYYDLREKYDVYETSGVKEYWIVDIKKKKIEMYTNKNKKFTLYCQGKESGQSRCQLLDFTIDIAFLFHEL